MMMGENKWKTAEDVRNENGESEAGDVAKCQ